MPYEVSISFIILLCWVAHQAVLWSIGALKFESTHPDAE